MKICVIGLGYIGLPTSAMFASHGCEVVGVDVVPDVVETLNRGKIHIEEPGLAQLIKENVEKGTFRASLTPEKADAFIISVPTPNIHDEFLSCDLTYVLAAAKSIVPYLEKGNTVIVESTISPKSTDDYVMPIFEEALDAYGLPLELKYLPIIESALNPSAVSRAGASGLWQFMIGTGKIYGLESNSLIDERRDPIKATWAAARYLKEMYDIYGDWNLVIAAYNCGPGTINKAIRRAGGETDYWKIYNLLPKETRGYVPAFIAANYVMTYYCDHNICPMETNIPASTDTVQVTKNLHFEQIAELCNVPLEEVKSLNPQYKKQVIPGTTKPCTLRLPQGAISTFIDKQDTIYAHRADELFRNRKTVAVKEVTPTTRRQTSAVAGKGKLTYYKIKSGDTLSSIAEKLGVRVKDIQQWNGMSNTRIAAGKQLKIYK